ncbi:MAG TPA: ATP-binding cassette domain-containing protein [Holophaga sp.]|nr:ATP-binding cassette domain-containing protein [Holophaga sp.]
MELRADFVKRYGNGTAVRAEFALDLDGFSVTVLFGPSGCGKTTILRCLAGLERPEEGRIEAGPELWYDGARGLHRPPHGRNIGLVFQDSALFPHLDVAANITFGLRRLSAGQRARRLARLLELVGLEGMGGRRTTELSGGQCQRVALARALAPGPGLLLLDEPFASLDRNGREQLRDSLRGILAESCIPTLLVTHDGHEALALGDRFLMMQDGCLGPGPAPDLESCATS